MKNFIYIDIAYILLNIILISLFYKIFKKLIIIRYRNKLFDLRTELFLYVRDSENLNFNGNYYIQIRYMLNGFIRYAERINLKLILLNAEYDRTHKIIDSKDEQDIQNLTKELNQNDKLFFSKLLEKVVMQNLLLLICINPILSLKLFLIYIYKSKSYRMEKMKKIKDEKLKAEKILIEKTDKYIVPSMINIGKNKELYAY